MRKAKKGETVLQMKGITKRFPGVVANDNIDLDIKAGEIHAILGENGAGKTTLMNILYGIYQPDEGDIYVNGKKTVIESPKDAIRLGIGMVHQNFMFISTFSVAENIILGLKSPREPLLELEYAESKITDLSKRYALEVDPKAKIWQLSVGEQQRVEILKALYREAHLLILDEPTSVLTPPEIEKLATIIKRMAKEEYAIIPFITHKMPEVMAVSDRVTVLRRGKVVGTVETKKVTSNDLAEMMVGRETFLGLKKTEVKPGKVILEVKGLRVLSDKLLPALKGITFSIREGEILGVAGVAGNGQRELEEVIVGLREATAGHVLINGKDVTNRSPKAIIDHGVGYIPEDRTNSGLIMDFPVWENLLLKVHEKEPFAYQWFLPFNKKWFLDYRQVNRLEELISEFDVKTPSKDAKTRCLSGGNLQRLLLARELSRNPKLLVAAQPTRGLDVVATQYIRKKFLEQRTQKTAILLISTDLDDIMSLSDRILVIYEGKIMRTLPREKVDIGELGLMMAGMMNN